MSLHLCRPGVNFLCDTDFDPFIYMEENDKVYSTRVYMVPPPKLLTMVNCRLHHLFVRVAADRRDALGCCERWVALCQSCLHGVLMNLMCFMYRIHR